MIEHILEPLVCKRFMCDARYREGHLRAVNALPERRVLGLHAPEMRAVAKQISREGCTAVMRGDENIVCTNGAEVIHCFEGVSGAELCYEETVVWGMLINIERCTAEERFRMLERYVPVLDNWAVCDSYCSHAKWMARIDKEVLWAFLQQWFDSKSEFEVRFAIVASMCYLLSKEWLEPIFGRLEGIDFDSIASKYRSAKGKPKFAQQGTVQGAEPYYVRMAVAWLLASALAKYPEQTRAFVGRATLPQDVVKLYIRKAKESRITKEVSAL